MNTHVAGSSELIDKLWYTRSPVPTPLGLASQLGLFHEEFQQDGISVYTFQETNDPDLRGSNFDHRLPHCFRQGGNVPAIWAKAKGANTRIIGLNWVDEYQAIITLPGSGIRTPRDLKGRRLALPKHNNSIDHGRAGALRGFLVTLETAGLDHRDVEFIDVIVPARDRGQGIPGRNVGPLGGYDAVIQELQQGRVDAIFVKGSRGIEASHALQVNIVYDIRQHPDRRARANNGAPRPITVNAELIEQRPDLVARFLKRVVEIGDWAALHPSETRAYIARETGSTEQWVTQAYGADLYLQQYTTLDPFAIAALDDYKNFLFKWNFIPNNFDLYEWIDPVPLNSLRKPELVLV